MLFKKSTVVAVLTFLPAMTFAKNQLRAHGLTGSCDELDECYLVELKDGGSSTTLPRYNVLEYFETDSRGYTVKCIRKNMSGGDMHSNLDSLTFEYGGLSHEGYDTHVPYYMAGGDDQWPTEVAYLTECKHGAKTITVIGKLAGEECFSEEYHLMLHCDPTPEYTLPNARQLSFNDKNKDKDDSSDDKNKNVKRESDKKNKDDSKDDSSDGKDKKDKREKDKDDSKDDSLDDDKKDKDDSKNDSSDDKDKRHKRNKDKKDKDKKDKDPTPERPSSEPSTGPSAAPSNAPSIGPSIAPSAGPSAGPSSEPSSGPSNAPSIGPSIAPSAGPSVGPSSEPSSGPSAVPSNAPSIGPSIAPSAAPSVAPSIGPSIAPSAGPSSGPSAEPSSGPSAAPSNAPSIGPSMAPSAGPSAGPSSEPSTGPSAAPSNAPSIGPSIALSAGPSAVAPTFPPTPGTTPPQVPTPPPRVPCLVDAEINCTLRDGRDCSALQPRDTNCIERLFYEFTLCNVGEVPLFVTQAVFTRNGVPRDYLSNLPVNPLSVGECSTFSFRSSEIRIDVCSGGEAVATIDVEADPPNGDMCQDVDTYITIIPGFD